MFFSFSFRKFLHIFLPYVLAWITLFLDFFFFFLFRDFLFSAWGLKNFLFSSLFLSLFFFLYPLPFFFCVLYFKNIMIVLSYDLISGNQMDSVCWNHSLFEGYLLVIILWRLLVAFVKFSRFRKLSVELWVFMLLIYLFIFDCFNTNHPFLIF